MKAGWKCPFTGEVFEENDPRLKGRGNPPSSPNTPPGMGWVPMQRVWIEEEDQKTKQKK